MMLRGNLERNWPTYLKTVVSQHNAMPKKRIGFMKPEQIQSVWDSVFVSDEQKKHNIEVYKEPNYKQQILNEQNPVTKVKENDYVYLSTEEVLFEKSFDVKASSSKSCLQLNFTS